MKTFKTIEIEEAREHAKIKMLGIDAAINLFLDELESIVSDLDHYMEMRNRMEEDYKSEYIKKKNKWN